MPDPPVLDHGSSVTFSDERMEIGPDNSAKRYEDIAPVQSQLFMGEPVPELPERNVLDEYERLTSEANTQRQAMGQLLIEYQRLLTLYPHIRPRNFNLDSDPMILAMEIDRIHQVANKPLHFEIYDWI